MKGLAAREITLLVLAILVLGIVAYLVYSQYLVSKKSISGTNCNTAIVSACISCKTCVISHGSLWGDWPLSTLPSGCSGICAFPSPSICSGDDGDGKVEDKECKVVGVT